MPDLEVDRWAIVRGAEHSSAMTEPVHWAYGAAGGAAFGLLPRQVRADPRAAPLYGLSAWLALDHALYGIVVAGRLAPAPEVRPS